MNVDRLVLITSPKSSIPIKEHLPRVLVRLRELPKGGRIDAAATSLEEEEILTVVRGHIARAWRDSTGDDISEENELGLLKLLWVEILDVEEDKAGEREAKDLLRAVVINDPAQAYSAFSTSPLIYV